MTSPRPMRRVAVVGGGWAGIAAAVRAVDLGHQVTVFDTAHHLGGRARSHPHQSTMLDNGQHILIGAYTDTLALMRRVGVDPHQVLHRQPLALVDARGHGLRLPAGPAAVAFVRGVLGWRTVPWRDRWQLLALAARWRLQGFECAPQLSVADLARRSPATVMSALIDPLCVAALNTPAASASAQVFLTVLRDALFSGPGACDLLLPRRPLDELLPRPAGRWLLDQGATLRLGQRVLSLSRCDDGWTVDNTPFDHVVLACSATEAARLLQPWAADWSRTAAALHYQPIVTVWLKASMPRWRDPMVSFTGTGPAQFAFDLGALGGPDGVYTAVVSGAQAWVDQGSAATADAVQRQWLTETGQVAEVITLRAEKRATFACTPGLARPDARPLPRLSVAGDYVRGPYPATLEGAVRAGLGAANAIG